MGRSLCTWFWLLGRVPLSVSSLNLVCMGWLFVFTDKLQAGLADELEDPRFRPGYQVGGGSVLVSPSTPASVGCLWDECVSAMCLPASIELDQQASRVPMEWVRGARGHTNTFRHPQTCLCL